LSKYRKETVPKEKYKQILLIVNVCKLYAVRYKIYTKGKI